MATVFNTIERVAGDPQQNALVSIDLVWDETLSPVAKIDGQSRMINGPWGNQTDDDGFWRVDLVPNDQILPAGSLYVVSERLEQNNETHLYYIEVPAQATPVELWAGDLIQPKPSWA